MKSENLFPVLKKSTKQTNLVDYLLEILMTLAGALSLLLLLTKGINKLYTYLQ